MGDGIQPMISTGIFHSYTPASAKSGVMYLQSNDGDWYALQSRFTQDTVKLQIDSENRIVAATRDPAALFPLNCRVVEVITAAEPASLASQYLIDGIMTRYRSVDQARAQRIRELNMQADRAIRAITDLYPNTEVDSWPQQQYEAVQIREQTGQHTPLLESIATQRGMEITELANRVLEKSSAWSALCGYVFGERQKIENALKEAGSMEDILAMDVTVTLPEGM